MKKPFTLIEILVAMSILSVFLLGLMQFYSSTESVLSSGVDRSEMFERARVAMDMMANDLTCIYYSQSDSKAKAFKCSTGNNGYFEAVTVRPEKLNPDAKTSIVAVKYEMGSSSGGANSLYYYYDSNGDNFSVSGASFSNKTELVEGVTSFSISKFCGDGCDLPALVVIRLSLLDTKSLKRLKANSSLKDTITKNPANVREFRRMIVIDRGQPKPKTTKSGS